MYPSHPCTSYSCYMNIFARQMSVRINVQADFGPYQPGTVLVTSVFHANRIISEYGRGVDIVDNRGRPSRPHPGATLYVRDRWGPRPPGPSQPRTNVTFGVGIDQYRRGNTYRLTAFEINGLLQRHSDVAIFTMNGTRVHPSQIHTLVMNGTHLRVDRLFTVYTA